MIRVGYQIYVSKVSINYAARIGLAKAIFLLPIIRPINGTAMNQFIISWIIIKTNEI
jgi:hypothetical protein